MYATGVTMGLAEWIIDDTCLVAIYNFLIAFPKTFVFSYVTTTFGFVW